VLITYDEMALLGTSRTSLQYRSNNQVLEAWREAAEVRVLGLTATPMSTSPECFFNLGNLIDPEFMGMPESTLEQRYKRFCDEYVTGYNRWDRPCRFKNLEGLERKLSRFMLRKRKTDPDVIDQFPKMVEKAVYLSLSPAHIAAYDSLDAFLEEQPERKVLPGFQALNAFVCHPRTVLGSGWEVAQEWLELYGRDKIAKLPAKKARAIIGYIAPIARAGQSGVIVFSNSVTALQCLAEDIDGLSEAEGFSYVQFHGGQTDKQNRDAKEDFKAGAVKVMLASSKAERGINLPEAEYIVNYGIPTTHSSYLQRAGRGSRIGSNVDGTLMIKTFITRGTIERATVNLWQSRNEWSDRLQDPMAELDPNFVSAFARRCMLMVARQQGDELEPLEGDRQ
jgi:SNF2 family DNA or RNA helicase